MKEAGIDKIELPASVKKTLEAGETGFTVVLGEQPEKIKGTANRNALVEKLILHPQARRLIERKPVRFLVNDETEAVRIAPPKISQKEGFEDSVITEIQTELAWQEKMIKIKGKEPEHYWPG